MAYPDIKLGSTFDAKGFKQAETASAKLGKTIKNLAGTFGLAFGSAAVVSFGKAAFKAFTDDEAAALRLSRAVDNLGIGFANPEISKFISELERTAGVADDILRPAFQGLLTTTGSLVQSQKLLNDAITISRASGVDLATVSEDLAKGYVGITKGLAKYNTGLTKSELSTKSFAEILNVLLSQSAGAAQDYLGTTAYKMDVLGVATSNASEIIGGGLVDAFGLIAGGTEASDAAAAIEGVASAIANVERAIGGAIGAIPNLLKTLKNLPKNIFEGFAGKQAGVTIAPKPKVEKTKADLTKEAQAKLLAKLEADAAKRAKDLAALQKTQTALTKKQIDAEKKRILLEKAKAALTKAAAVFDLNKISIAAALKATYDKDERLRLLAMQEIENENGETALKYIDQLNILTKEQQANKLAGIRGISETELSYINQLLLDELDRIRTTKMSEEEAAAARAAAYAKYNAAIIESGGLNDVNFYSEKTQIELLDIMRRASLDKAASAQATYNLLNYTTQTDIIAKIAAAQKLADDAKYKALQDYLALLNTPIKTPVVEPPPSKYPDGLSFGVGGQPIWDNGYSPGYNTGQGTGSIDNSLTVVVEGNVLNGDDFDEAVSAAMRNAQRAGYSMYPAGSLP